MSKTVKVWELFCWMFLNHSITSLEFCHWFKFNLDHNVLSIFCNIGLLILPSWLFVGFSKHYFGSSLWSFSVTKHSCFAMVSNLPATSKGFTVFLTIYIKQIMMIFWRYKQWNSFIQQKTVMFEVYLLNTWKLDWEGSFFDFYVESIAFRIKILINIILFW